MVVTTAVFALATTVIFSARSHSLSAFHLARAVARCGSPHDCDCPALAAQSS